MLSAAEHTAKNVARRASGTCGSKGKGWGGRWGKKPAKQNVMCVLSVVWERVRSGAGQQRCGRQQMAGLVPLRGSC